MKVKLDEKLTGYHKKEVQRFSVRIIALFCSVLAAIVILCLIGYKTFLHEKGAGYKSPYELADDFVTYTYQGDTESIFKMQPAVFQERSIHDNQMKYAMTEDEVKQAIENLKKPLAEYIETLNTQHGEWTETHEVAKDMYEYTDDELFAMQELLKSQGIDEEYVDKISKIGIVDVDVDLTASNDSGGYPHVVHVPVYKHGSFWYLGQRIGDVFTKMTEGDHDPYGDLLDGFTIVNRETNEEGYEILVDPETRREYYQDSYGNKYFYDENGHEGGNIVETTGPDGGEVLTEDTWEDYWNNYYESQGLDIYPEYQIDEWGNTQYLDEDGNVTNTVGPDGGEPLTKDTYWDYWNEHSESVNTQINTDESEEESDEELEKELDEESEE